MRIINKILLPSRVSVSGISRRMMVSSSRSNSGSTTDEGQCILSSDENITSIKKILKWTKGSGEHDFGPVEQFFAPSGRTSHGRICERCGVVQGYGRAYGSNRSPNYERIDPHCPPLGKKEGDNIQ